MKEGKQYIRGYHFTRADLFSREKGCGTHEWHCALNGKDTIREQAPHWMYTAMLIRLTPNE